MLLEMKNNNEKKTRLEGKRLLFKTQKVFVIVLLLLVFTTKSSLADVEKSNGLQTIYHIYSEGKYIGVLSDASKLDQLKQAKVNDQAPEYEKLSLTFGTEISIVQEQVFTAGTDDDLVLGKLDKMLSVEAEAIGIQVGEELALYVNMMSDYDEVIRQMKLQSINEEELNAYEAQKVSSTPIPPLTENETRITEVNFSEDIEAVQARINPKNVVSVDEALALLTKGTLESKKYAVQPGDHLGKIAADHDMTSAQLLEINPGVTDESTLHIGDEFNVTLLEPFVEVEVHYEAKKIETIKYDKLTEKDSSLFKGDNKVKQNGSDGEREITELIRKRNGKVVGKSIIEETILVKPQSEITLVGTKVTPSRGTGAFKWPAVGGYISSQMGKRWGRMHGGIDIARPSSRSILASDNGVVKSAGWSGSYGNRIIISHNNGYETLYAHLSSINVKVGQTVPQGNKIGVMGQTGRSTGIHLHFEVKKNGSLINPMSVLR